MYTREEAQKINRIISILKEHEIEISVSGCGCCGSPRVSFSYKGEVIADNELDFEFDSKSPPTSANTRDY